MGFDIPGIDVDDLNPLHWINKANHAFGDSLASNLEFLGITDPAVDPDGIREITKQWRALAKGLDAAAHDAETALKDLEWEGEAAKALHKRAKTARTQATNMADSLRDGAKALDDFADEAHELLTEIGVILAEIAEFEIASLALSVLTGGLSVIAGNLAAGARAAKVVALIARIEKSGTRMASVIRTVMEAIRGLERTLKALGEIKTIAKAGKLAGDGMKFAAFDALLKDPGTFKDPGKLAEALAAGAAFGVGLGGLGKLLGKGLGKLKPSELAKLGRTLGLDGSGLSRLKLRPAEWEKLPASIKAILKKLDRDPIDVATGDVLLPQTDVELPGTLPLLLERTHLSSYRWGGWFGPSWASTLDQRLQADDEGVIYTTSDGIRLVYPHPAAGAEEPVYPEVGPRLPLTWDVSTDGGMRVTDPITGQTCIFHSPQPTDEGDAVDLPLQEIVDRNGQRITIHYRDDGTPAEVRHSGGYRVAIDCHPDLPRIAALRLLDSHRPEAKGIPLVSYGYNDSGHLTEVTNSSGLSMRFTYDEAGRITSWTDRNGTSYTYAYDDRGRVVRTEGSGGFLSGALAYDDATHTTHTTHTTTVTDSRGNVTRYEHNEAFRLVRLTDPLGNITCQEWDDEHRLTAVTDPLGHTTRYRYTEQGRPVSITRPDGRELASEYNELGLVTQVIGPDGSIWREEYDERGNRTASTDPTGATTQYAHDTHGHIKQITDALGHTTRLRCNAAGLPVEFTDPLGATTHLGRDIFGRTVTMTDALGHTTRMEWTADGQLASRTTSDGTSESWTYDGEGNCTSHTNGLGAITRFEYTHFDLMSARTGPDGARHTFTHDTELRLTEVTNSQGMSWCYEYDAAGRLSRETDFNGRSLTYTHDPAGRPTSRSNALGETLHFAYDELGRLVRKDAHGADTAFTYGPAGQLTQAVGPDATVLFERDAAGRLLAETVNGRTTTYSYDLLGRRTHRTTPTGALNHRAYDAVGSLTRSVTADRAIDFDRDAEGRETTRRIDSVLTLASSFDGLGRMVAQSVTGPEARVVQHRAFSYRPDDNLIRIDDHLSGTRHFELDTTGRVTAVRAADWTESYTYDGAGNQTNASWPQDHPGQEAAGPRSYTGTRITRAGGVRYEHDAVGRIVLRQKTRLSRKPDTWRYSWDTENRLTEVVTPDGTTWRYQYDPLGRRIAKQRLDSDGSTAVEETAFTWDGTTLCEQTTTGSELPNAVTLTWDHEDLRPLCQLERVTAADAPQDEIDTRFFSIVTDLVGTPTELLDESGGIAWRSRTTLWGITAWTAQSTAYTPLRFPGQYFDPETALHYNYFRHYDPETARYLTQDPLGLDPAPNPDTYVNNPHTWTDPLGLAPYNIHASVAYQDWGTKGAHIHIKNMEVRIFPNDKGGIGAEGIRMKHGTASNAQVQKVLDEIHSNPALRNDIIDKATSARNSMNKGEFGMNKNRAAELHFIIKNLEKLNKPKAD
ncbi:DUF6531 domain-containing protein [Streptomyces sp. NPDC058308]|uniref:DUF6531 domain-containing protein n=1 Tax=Streptomyces sp. NPDC058308 TaxID=3346440 RepID=UPI0036EAB026